MQAFFRTAALCTAAGCVLLGLSIVEPLSTVSAGSSAKQRGAALFADHGCAHCHGPAGVGGAKGPDLQLVRKRMNKEQITQQIHDGGLSMPAFGSSLTDPQIQDLVAYLRAKRKVIIVPPQPHPATPAPTPADPDDN